VFQHLIIYMKCRAGLARPAFFDWWLGHHSTLATRLPGLHWYIISLAADEQEGPFDGLAELWCDDLVAANGSAMFAMRPHCRSWIARGNAAPTPGLAGQALPHGVE